ncbi:MAG: AAA family ATPase, partial [Thermoguttaceae bacterium]|nr:AAA family ATPase [Thermoguttaceae bacterium]
MSVSAEDNLLARLAGKPSPEGGSDPWSLLAATEPDHDQGIEKKKDDKLEALLSRINRLAEPPRESGGPGAGTPPSDFADPNTFLPIEPESFQQAGLSDSEVEALALKYLLARGDASGREIAEQIKLPFVLVDTLLRQMKNDQLVVHRAAAPMNDFQYELTELGRERARRLAQHCSYFGAAPVALADYVAAVAAQSLTKQHPTAEALRQAFGDLLLSPKMLDRLGPAVNSGRGLFLYGAPGNGKTSIAERVTAAFGQYIWIPRAIGIDGEIIRLFDPVNHEEAPIEATPGLIDQRRIDKRWVRIRRPTIIAAGELTMASLEVAVNVSTGICEAPLQLKSNCGTLVIDDFGRQRMRIDELLNRWIVPLEKHYDFLNLPNGKKIQVPFDQLLVFSTNLEPQQLVDEAFLRRIPYKIEVLDPNEAEFRRLFELMAPKLGFEYRQEPVDYLIDRHYKRVGRPFRFCHPRDLLLQVRNFCAYRNEPLV